MTDVFNLNMIFVDIVKMITGKTLCDCNITRNSLSLPVCLSV